MVINRQKRVPVKLRALDMFLGKAAKLLRVPRDAATICFVSDAQIASWNRTYRRKAIPTDVLSFPAANGRNHNRKAARNSKLTGNQQGSYLGDIAIAPAVARRNALKSGSSFDAELKVLMLHGLLHLIGYDHESDNGAMDRIEARLRRKLGLA